MKINTVNICGVDISNVTLEDVYDVIKKKIEKRQPSYIVTPNADHIVKLQKNAFFRKIYRNAHLVLADGKPVIWASRFLKKPIREKISGSDLFPKLCRIAAVKKYKLFFLGGNPGDAEKVKKKYIEKYPGIKIAGVYSPAFGFEKNPGEINKIVNLIKQTRADILFVGLGAPKQEKFIYEHYRQMGVPVSIGIGISFSFEAGSVRRAPKWMQAMGLEWFFRLLQEPKRLWKRYLFGNLKFIWLVIKEFIKKHRNFLLM